MKVIFNQAIAGADFYYTSGQVVELPSAAANEFLNAGFCEVIEEKQAVKTESKAPAQHLGYNVPFMMRFVDVGEQFKPLHGEVKDEERPEIFKHAFDTFGFKDLLAEPADKPVANNQN